MHLTLRRNKRPIETIKNNQNKQHDDKYVAMILKPMKTFSV